MSEEINKNSYSADSILNYPMGLMVYQSNIVVKNVAVNEKNSLLKFILHEQTSSYSWRPT